MLTAGLFGTAAALSVFVRLAHRDQTSQDTIAVVIGARNALDCLAEGTFARCRYVPGRHLSWVTPYPLLQYVPAAVLVRLGLAQQTIVDALAWLNAMAVAAATYLVVTYARARGGARAALVALVAMVSGMLVSYAGATVGEPLAMLAFVGVSLLALRAESSPLLAPAAFFAVIGKETFAPVVALFVVGGVLMSASDRTTNVRKLRWAALGVGTGVAANALFNVFRFGSARNVEYLHQATQPSGDAVLKSAVSLVAAPNAGLLFFWFLGAAAVAVIVIVFLHRLLVVVGGDRSVAAWRRALGPGAVVLGMLVAVGTLSFWWMPFGWYSWGPRLLVPFVPPLFLFVARLVGRPAGRMWVWSIVVMAIAWILAAPNLAFVFAPDISMVHWTATLADHVACNGIIPLRTAGGMETFHQCLMAAAWRTSPAPLREAVKQATNGEGVWFWGTFALASIALVTGILAVAPSGSVEPDLQ